MKDKIKKAIDEQIDNLKSQIKTLEEHPIDVNDVKYKVWWSDNIYPGRPEDDNTTDSFESAINWLSRQSHPMGFSGCYMGVYSFIVIDEVEIEIESFRDVEKLASERRR